MTSDGGAIQSFLATASAGELLLQFGVMAGGGLAAMGAASLLRRWRARHLPLLNLRGARARLIEITLIEAAVVVALLTMLVARTVIAAVGMPATLLAAYLGDTSDAAGVAGDIVPAGGLVRCHPGHARRDQPTARQGSLHALGAAQRTGDHYRVRAPGQRGRAC